MGLGPRPGSGEWWCGGGVDPARVARVHSACVGWAGSYQAVVRIVARTSASLLCRLIHRVAVLVALLCRRLAPLQPALPLGLLLLLPAYFLLPLLEPIVTLWQDDSSEGSSDYASGLVPVMRIR